MLSGFVEFNSSSELQDLLLLESEDSDKVIMNFLLLKTFSMLVIMAPNMLSMKHISIAVSSACVLTRKVVVEFIIVMA